jgi:hypothetical protein
MTVHGDGNYRAGKGQTLSALLLFVSALTRKVLRLLIEGQRQERATRLQDRAQ